MTDEIRAGLIVDQSAFQAGLAGMDARQAQIDQRNLATRQRVDALLSKLKIAEAEARTLEATTTRILSRGVRFAGKAAVAYAAGEVLSELGIPEAARPLMHIGTAALGGASMGPWGAAGFATIAMVQELWRAYKRNDENQERLRAEMFQQNERMRRQYEELREVEEEKKKRLEERFRDVDEKAKQKFADWFQEGARALYVPQY